MLTSSVVQYINPDYLQPLPTTLDAKKSPLALLAQTCSSIGKDSNSTPTSSSSSSSTKSLIPSVDKKDSEKQSDKTSNSEARRREAKESNNSNGSKPGFRTIVNNKDIQPQALPVTTRTSDDTRFSPNTKSLTSSPRLKDYRPTTSPTASDVNVGSARSNSSQSSASHHTCENKDEDKLKRPTSKSPSRFQRDSSSTIAETKLTSNNSAHPSSYGSFSSVASYPHRSHTGISSAEAAAAAAHFAGYPMPLPAHGAFGAHTAAAAALAAQSSALAAQSNAALKSGLGTSFSPYVTYARVRTPSGATTLVPVCRDPYCTHCQLTEQNAHLSSTCTVPGCAQCAHEKSLHSLSLGLSGTSYPHLQSLSSSGLLTSLSSGAYSSPLYHHSALSGHMPSSSPSVCNWVTPSGDQCGKRFTSSEELLHHLRTHTTSSDPLSLAAAYDRYGLTSPAAALSGLHGHLSQPGSSSLSPNSLRRGYPTSLSPLSGLVGSSRYHPYKSMISPAAGLPSAAQHPSNIAQYLSPYSLYGPRVGPAAVP